MGEEVSTGESNKRVLRALEGREEVLEHAGKLFGEQRGIDPGSMDA